MGARSLAEHVMEDPGEVGRGSHIQDEGRGRAVDTTGRRCGRILQRREVGMLGSQVLEVAIGLVLMYLLLSLICSSIREAIEAGQKARALDLERGIRELFQDPR
jgi:hypothetical protein